MVIKPSTFFSSISMAPKQKTTQQKTHKNNNLFLACFGFSKKSTSSSSMKKQPKKPGTSRNKFKLCWPKLKVIIIEKKNIILDPKTAALKASHDIILEATKVHQPNKLIDHQVKDSKEPNVLSKGSNHHKDNKNHPKSQSYCATCHNHDNSSTLKPVKCSIFANKVFKDSLIGLSIMVAMLIIMSIWGRLCAILCMSAWLYCIPLIRPANRVIPNHKETELVIGDLNTEVYKKNVVLQGLLQRDHKTTIGIS